jgi:hypothetical protein
MRKREADLGQSLNFEFGILKRLPAAQALALPIS